MQKYFHLTTILLLLVILYSCKQSTNEKVAPKTWYKRYTGTIAGQQVVVNLNRYGKNELMGTYYYSKQGILLTLASDDDSTKGDTYCLFESATNSRSDENDYHNNAHWAVSLRDGSITGKWMSLDGKTSGEIKLKEDDGGGMYKLDLLNHVDSVIIQTKHAKIGANSSYLIAYPGEGMKAEQLEFMESVLLDALSGSETEDRHPEEVITRLDKAYFKDYKETMDSSSDISADEAAMNTYDRQLRMWPIYTDKGMVIYELMGYEYSGGAHGMYGSTFACLDVFERKIWGLEEIMNVDSVRLLSALRDGARTTFGIPVDSTLTPRLLVDTIPVTDNIYFTHTGITFNYQPYEIACYADGQISIYVPYNKVMDMLKPEFKKRMKLP